MLHVAGMHGLGDNLHERAVVRQLMERDRVELETPWPSVFHDLAGPRLRLVSKGSTLRTQAKNAAREAARFSGRPRIPRPSNAPLRVSYAPADVRACGSVLGAMMRTTGTDIRRADFRLPVPAAWHALLDEHIPSQPARPLLLLRPLVERTEWAGCAARNPAYGAYAELYRAIRRDFFVVSVADLEPGKEWMVGERLDADVEFHRGELVFEALAALAQRAALVFASPGFAIPLAQAVGTPSVAIFGGYEDSHSFAAGARQAPSFSVDPIHPCQCFAHAHGCDKRIDVHAALEGVRSFVASLRTVAP